MASGKVTVEVKLRNAKAVERLAFAADLLRDLAESQPWNRDLRKAARGIRYALKSLELRQTK